MNIEPTINRDQPNELTAPDITIDETNEASVTLQGSEPIEEPAKTEEPKNTEEPAPKEAAPTGGDVETPPAIDIDPSVTTEPVEPLEFTPSFKYKVRDEEHEIEEWARPFIKDEATQKKFQDLYTKGHGLEIAKTERDEYRTKFTNVEKSLNILNGYVQDYYKNPQSGGDAARNFIDSLGLPKEMFLQYAINELKYQNMTPEQRSEVDTVRQQNQYVNQLQMTNQQLAEQNEQIALNQRKLELNNALTDSQVSGIAQEYDSRAGRQGAFQDLVIERGIFQSQVNGVDIPVQQAISEVVNMLAVSNPQGTAPTTQTGHVGTQPAQTQNFNQQQKPVLPNISGHSAASPVKRVVGSIQDIKDRYKQMTNQ